MKTIHLISHTHWDREWYLTFQQFRLKLVHLIDNLLELFAADPRYQYYMLDGQTIVLDDYLQIHPEREDELRALVQSGRLLIGPWHILPDEFLVSPEATIRNLLQGERTAQRFGSKMQIGYIPDPFGHLGQMPQILTGFGIHSACVQRGLSDEPCEFWWQSPDGSRVLMAYLRDGYGNAAALPAGDQPGFLAGVNRLCESLEPYTHTNHLLLMQGTDHMEAQPGTSTAIAYANLHLQDKTILHSNLPAYMAAIQMELPTEIPTVTGELRSSKRHHLLPGVLSTRMWIKQRNHTCETLLEKWVEPFTTLANQSDQLALQKLHALIRYAWRLLMECHPHDSICGCSIDQVHDEMRSRFDQVEQLAEELTRQSLEQLSLQINTLPVESKTSSTSAIVCFNPSQIHQTGPVEVDLQIHDASIFHIIDSDGQQIPYEVLRSNTRGLTTMVLDRSGLMEILASITDGKVTGLATPGLVLRDVKLHRQANELHIHAILAEFGDPDAALLERLAPEMLAILADDKVQKFILRAEVVCTRIRLLAKHVPPLGYRTFFVTPAASPQKGSVASDESGHKTIANEFFSLTVSPVDGTFTLTDLRTGEIFPGLNHFVDGGDCGDEYNYSPPASDQLISPVPADIQIKTSALSQSIQVTYEAQIPASLSPDRQARATQKASLCMTSTATLLPGVARLDIRTEIDNPACDHRLRVHFPASFTVSQAKYDGHFHIVPRPIGVPTHDASWVEAPRPEAPQRAFTAIENDRIGILIANRGLPEVEVIQNHQEQSEVALTLLRCVGWLSRDDFSTRRGHAGPGLSTPGAQMIGHWSFDYAVVPYRPVSEEDKLAAYHLAYAFAAGEMRAISTPLHAGTLAQSQSLIQVTPPAFLVSALKPAEDSLGWILRGYNLTSDPLQITLGLWKTFPSASRFNLAEQPIGPLHTTPNGKLRLDVHGHEIITLKFRQAGE